MRSAGRVICAIVLVLANAREPAAQDANWSTASIPASLRENANVVKRYESIKLEVQDISNASISIRQVLTILNEKGKGELAFHQYTTRYIELKSAEIRVYDSLGRQTEKYKRKDLQSASMGEGLVEDGQVVYFFVVPTSYPLTVEYEYEIRLSGTLNLPSYQVCDGYQSLQESYFSAKVPPAIGFRWQAKNIKAEPSIESSGGQDVYQWQFRNLAAPLAEEGSASTEDCFPSVRMTLNRFSFYGHEGDLSSWESFGGWIGTLYRGLDELPSDRKEFFQRLVNGASTDSAKARIIYEYLQRNFRYVSIQLGIGGLKPFSASFTDQKKYGDCKALSNYMKAALSAVGIRSNLAIINAGYNDEPVDPSFPINGFNHVILCIPRQKDSIWLECTSSTTSFGELGTFTENRNALLITESGGKLVSTPKSRSRENIYQSHTVVGLDADGGGLSKTVFQCRGVFREMMDHIYRQKRDDQKESIVGLLNFKQPDDFEFVQQGDGEAQTDTLLMSIEKVHEFKAGNKYFLPPRIYRIWEEKLPAAGQRKLDYYFPFPFELSDTTVYLLPEGYGIEALPVFKSLTCEYGSYRTSCWFDEKNRALYTAGFLQLKEHHIPAEKYRYIKEFFDGIMEDEAQRLVIKSQ